MNVTPFIVLLVEDDQNDALLLQRAFHRARLTSMLQVVSNAKQAMAYLGQLPPFDKPDESPTPSLLLLDLNLPGTSGLELLEWLRQQPSPLKNLPVIILTSSRDTEDIDRAYELGANSYMAKPSGNFDELAELVRELKPQA